MTDKLPPNLLALFAPRPPLRWVPHPDYPPEQRKTANISGLGGFLDALKEYKDNDNYVPTESWLEARDRKKLEKKAAAEKLLTEAPKLCEIYSPRILFSSCESLLTSRLQTSPRKTQTSAAMPSRP